MPRSSRNPPPPPGAGERGKKKTMSVKYKLYQVKSKNTKINGKWAARVMLTAMLSKLSINREGECFTRWKPCNLL